MTSPKPLLGPYVPPIGAVWKDTAAACCVPGREDLINVKSSVSRSHELNCGDSIWVLNQK